MTFQSLGLSSPILAALDAQGYNKPTPIQAQAIPPVLAGKDLVGIAQTGTGKTAAFVLPTMQRLTEAAPGRPVPGRARMLVLAPTRELAAQIATSARNYAAGQHVRVGVVFGGVPVPRSIREVSRGLDILVATPGRLLDLVDQRALDLSALEILVLDEADQMLDLGFIHDLKRIVKIIPEKRQTLFFSATMPKQIRQLADRFCHHPVEVKVTPVGTTAERVRQAVTFVNQREKQALLNLFFQTETIDRSLVFSRTKHGADRIVRRLGKIGIEAAAIHGNKSQPQREKALAAFREGSIRILVATDIAARGIDIPGVSHVVNFDLPNVADQYVHRIGRTARAGAEGIAYSFCDDEERPYLRGIEKLIRQRIGDVPLPENFNEAVAAVEDAGEDRGPRRSRRPRHPIKPKGQHGKPANGAKKRRPRPQRKGQRRPASA
ncbi:DEAD/DEAH box helicase [Sphingomicrobium lutaoense]|uniref:DEAD-box ATP-dependent RNA helicase RhpA n=1 Tax=Sphingomicrobium lutaoense TaxID=515949 RepID=A0A839Z0R4_9SPHN|nr:DEAD/DEAH box helicase [Sphingomicrobium lutaoense]MBB3764856.1 ATP-dependent RNA helicase RhlE [Sphingomicrobium lutaoense]